MQKLRQFHEYNLQVEHEFNLFHQIEYYESLRNETKSVYRDYEETKRKMYELKEYIDKSPKKLRLLILMQCLTIFYLQEMKFA